MKSRVTEWFASIPLLLSALLLASCGGGSSPEGETTAQAAPRMKALAEAPLPIATITGITKVSESRVSRTVYDYVFKVTVQNGSVEHKSISAQLVATGTGTTTIDGDVYVGDLAAGAVTTPEDTITLRHDRAYPFMSAALQWNIKSAVATEKINGIVVPPLPDAVLNKSTVGGIDVNGNGVRDDIERQLAMTFGLNPTDFALAMKHSQTLGAAIANPNDDTVRAHVAILKCLPSIFLEQISLITRATLDTDQRRRGYATAFAGVSISAEGCQK